MERKKAMSTRELVMYAVLTAIVIVLQYVGAFIKFGPFSVTLVLIPIIVGAAILGPKAGAWLGGVFGLMVLLTGDANAFLTVDFIGTIVTVMAKGVLSGFVAGVCYKLVSKKAPILAVFISALVCPIVNTGVFLLGCFAFFMEAITLWAAGSTSVAYYIIFVLVGGNFLFEIGINVILAPVIIRLLTLKRKNLI